MRKFSLLLLVAITIGGGGWLFDHYSLEGLKTFKFRPRKGGGAAVDSDDRAGDVESVRPLKVAAFKIRAFGPATLQRPHAQSVLVQVARRFDILVITDIDPRGAEGVASLVDAINAIDGDARHFDSIVGPAVGRGVERRMALVFDADRVDVDRGASYVVADPDRLLEHPPLVGWFRAREAAADAAFTFSVMAVDCQAAELDTIGAAYRAVRDDGRGEDDVILAGDFAASDAQLEPLTAATRLAPAIVGIPTNTQGDRQGANVLYSNAASEFTGRAGVMDIIRQFNLTVEQALAISDEMPVWAEFAQLERDRDGLAAGGRPVFHAGDAPSSPADDRQPAKIAKRPLPWR